MNRLARSVLRRKIRGGGSFLRTGYRLHSDSVGFAWQIYGHRS
jgi:hypothetical protein